MSEPISYRNEAESENFDSNRKEFLSILPVGSGYIFIFFVLFLSLLASSLFFINMPVKIQGHGFFVSGHQQSPITFEEDNFLINEIFVNKNEPVYFNQQIMRMSSRHKPGNERDIKNLNQEISRIDELISTKYMRKADLSARHDEIINQHEKVILTISKQLWDMKKYEADEKAHFEKGLSNKKEWQLKKENTQHMRIRLEESKQMRIQIEQDYNESVIQIEREIDELHALLSQRKRELDRYNDIIIRSPCDCEVGEIFIKQNDLTEKNKVLMTLLSEKPGKEANIYIPSHQFKPIEIGSRVLIKPDAYPTLKYGSIYGHVTAVSESTVSGKHYPDKFKPTDNFFKISVEISHLPDMVHLQSGMEFKGEIILEHLTLFNFIFE